MIDSKTPPKLSPLEFEIQVRNLLDGYGVHLKDYRSTHREIHKAVDGEYEIDITARFEAMGAGFLVIVECKRYYSVIKRSVVEQLSSKVQSLGANKGIIVATSRFQSGAINYALAHGITLIEFRANDVIKFDKNLNKYLNRERYLERRFLKLISPEIRSIILSQKDYSKFSVIQWTPMIDFFWAKY